LGWEKSKRWRSGATRGPFCATWSPSTWRPRGTRLVAQALHRGVEGVGVDRDAARAQRILGEIERESVGVVEREGGLAGEPVAARQRCGFLVQDATPRSKV